MKTKILGLLAAVLLLPVAALASPITYIYSGVASGSFAGTAFNGADFVITAQADTANIGPWCCSNAQNTHLSATVAISGVSGVETFTEATQTWIAEGCCMGFGRNLSTNLITLFDPAITQVGYGLATPFGPITTANVSTQGQFVNVGTTGGLLTIDALRYVTFQALAVPEPGSLALLGLGLAGLGLSRRRKAN